MKYQLHPLCSLFPRMDGAEFDALCADIKANGLRHRIVLHDGMVLDGGNRYRACEVVGVDPLFEDFEGDSLVAFVLSENLHRRHMTAGQQAAIVASAQDWSQAQTVGNPAFKSQSGNVAALETVAQRAAKSGAGERTQRMADKVAKADPALAREVAHGNVSLPKAHATVAAPRTQPDTAPSTPVVTQPDDGEDIVAIAQELQADVERLQADIKALTADDTKAELLKVRRQLDHAQRQQSEAMDRAKQATDREAWTARQLRRCGKAVNELDPTKIAAAVEALARDSGMKVAA